MDAYVIIKKTITKIIMEKYYHVMLKGRKQNITCPLRLKHFKNEACLLNTTEGWVQWLLKDGPQMQDCDLNLKSIFSNKHSWI